MWEGKRRFRRYKACRERRLRCRTDVDAIDTIPPKYSEEDRDYLSLQLADPRSTLGFSRSDSTDKWRWIIACALRL